MFRFLLSLCVLVGLAANAVAAEQPSYDFSAWKRIPVLDDGRIKPLDSFADEVVTLVTGRAKWTDPKTNRRYKAPELLYNWITKKEEWLGKPIIRCEYRPLRELLLGADQREGTFIAITDFIDWDRSREEGTLLFHKKEVQERFEGIERATRSGKKSPSQVGETAEERKLNGKAAELVKHAMAFLTAAEARNLYVVPGLDPRTLTHQFDPDTKLKPWISLGTLMRLDEWQMERDVTVAALMARDRNELEQVVTLMRLYVNNEKHNELAHLPQLAQALSLQSELRPQLEAIKPALEQTRHDYDGVRGRGPNDFARSMSIFTSKLNELGRSLDAARQKMGPLADGPADYKPLPLDEGQMQASAYPSPGAMETEILYNEVQPFYVSCWIYGLAAMMLLSAWILASINFHALGRSLYLLGLGVTTVAIAFATWGFVLRIIIAGRPPVTNMYETVIWVSYVVSILGAWFGLLPLIWPGLQWAWRLTAIPFSWEDEKLSIEDERRTLANFRTPIGIVSAGLRLAGFLAIVWFLTQSDSTFRISSLTPPLTDEDTFAPNAVLTWLIGLSTVLASAWYLPRAVLALVGSVFLVVPELRKVGWAEVWEQTFSRRLFLVTSIPVALFGMVLAYNVGNISPEILNPRIGSIAAVLRNNYWLTIHVLTIVSSYGAGALVWGLGNLAMLYYLFGRYSPSTGVDSSLLEKHLGSGAAPGNEGVFSRLKTAGRGLAPKQIRKTFSAGIQGLGSGDAHLATARVQPPKDVSTLAAFGYKGMQVAVLLLAAGTILGGLWADVSWGRFWDWDPKEVWALISLLVYLAFLHGRYAGWVGTFGTNAGSVLCFQAIVMSWYGVNFVLPKIHGWWNGTGESTSVGLHSYAPGEASGLEWVALTCFLNVLLVGVAWARYAMEMSLTNSAATVAGNGDGTTTASTPVREPVESARD